MATSKTDFNYHELEFDTVTLENKKLKKEHKSVKYFVEELDATTSLEMIYIPGGTFMMGASEEDGYEGRMQRVGEA
ncbi:hypothetical protein [Acaryochloris marina]|uniref:hypothetical protein n=1 Tax=Acaryochloris marina TaxID=155978 RepID=UPI001BAF4199|nr:hypothetical protein [Acaryochloris marina]QUY44798.1 hypothetical protein I1H34_12340 [Acaryochloris marina S15]